MKALSKEQILRSNLKIAEAKFLGEINKENLKTIQDITVELQFIETAKIPINVNNLFDEQVKYHIQSIADSWYGKRRWYEYLYNKNISEEKWKAQNENRSNYV